MWLSFSRQHCWVNEGAPQRETGANASLESNIARIRYIQRTQGTYRSHAVKILKNAEFSKYITWENLFNYAVLYAKQNSIKYYDVLPHTTMSLLQCQDFLFLVVT